MIEYLFTNPYQVDAVGGDAATGTKWRVQFEGNRLTGYNGTLAKIAADMQFCFDMLGVTDVDNLQVTWKNATTVTVSAGRAVASDGAVLTIASATDVNELDTGSLDVSRDYFLWIGKSSVSGETVLRISLSADAPTNMTSAHRLKQGFFQTNSSSQIIQFSPVLAPNIPIGIPVPWVGSYAPVGCVFCNGAAKSRTAVPWAILYALCGTTYGVGDGSTTFNLPDIQGRVIVGSGSGSGLTTRTTGTRLGEEAHLLIISEMPSHNHALPVYQSGGGANVFYGSGTAVTSPISSDYTGGGGAHNNMQPSLVMPYIIRII